MWRVKDQIEQLDLAEIDPDGIKAYLDAVLENGGNEQKKYLLRGLVAKVLVHDKDRYEFTFKLLNGSTLQHALETVPEHDANSLYINQLVHTVFNQEHAIPSCNPLHNHSPFNPPIKFQKLRVGSYMDCHNLLVYHDEY